MDGLTFLIDKGSSAHPVATKNHLSLYSQRELDTNACPVGSRTKIKTNILVGKTKEEVGFLTASLTLSTIAPALSGVHLWDLGHLLKFSES